MEPLKYCEANALRYIDMLIFLENLLGRHACFTMLNPGDIPPAKDYNVLARSIAEFLGLTNQSFVVCKIKKEQNIGGTIDQDGRFSFIEISDQDYTPQNILAILSHEIMHRFLSLKGIGKPNEAENEMLTDIAAIYVGLGKLVLNGVYGETERMEIQADRQIVHKSTHRIGYLDFESFCFVYLILCRLRGIPEQAVYSHLKKEAADALARLHADPLYRKLAGCFDANALSEAEGRLRALESAMLSQVERLNALIALISELMAEKGAMDGAYAKLLEDLRRERDGVENNPVMKKLRAIQSGLALQGEMDALDLKLDRFRQDLARFESALSSGAESDSSPRGLKKLAFWKRKGESESC